MIDFKVYFRDSQDLDNPSHHLRGGRILVNYWLNITKGKEVIIADSSNFGQAIEDFHNQSMEYKNSLASNARQYVIESKYINEHTNTIVIILSMYVPELCRQLMNMGIEGLMFL